LLQALQPGLVHRVYPVVNSFHSAVQLLAYLGGTLPINYQQEAVMQLL